MDEFSKLLALLSAAESCNGATRQFVEDYSKVPEWSHFRDGTLCQPAADSQAAEHIRYLRLSTERLEGYIHEWIAACDALYLISEAVASHPSWPIFNVNGQTYNTAHEASRAAAEWMVEVYRASEGWKDRDFIDDVARRLNEIGPIQDFAGYIEREHFLASPLVPLAPDTTPPEAYGKTEQKIRPTPKTLEIIREIQKGLDNDTVVKNTGTTVGNARKVRTQLAKNMYEV